MIVEMISYRQIILQEISASPKLHLCPSICYFFYDP